MITEYTGRHRADCQHKFIKDNHAPQRCWICTRARIAHPWGWRR